MLSAADLKTPDIDELRRRIKAAVPQADLIRTDYGFGLYARIGAGAACIVVEPPRPEYGDGYVADIDAVIEELRKQV